MKTYIIIAILFLASGCITQEDLQIATDATTATLAAVEENRELMDKLVDFGVLDQEEAAKVNKNIDKVIADTKTLRDTIVAAETPTEAITGVIEASGAMGNPYAKPMAAGFGLISTLLAVWGNQQRKSRNKTEAKRQADKEGRERTLREIAAMDQIAVNAASVKSLMYSNIGDARSRKGVI
jgi:hypothetical protein